MRIIKNSTSVVLGGLFANDACAQGVVLLLTSETALIYIRGKNNLTQKSPLILKTQQGFTQTLNKAVGIQIRQPTMAVVFPTKSVTLTRPV